MVEEAVQHELETLRKLVMELSVKGPSAQSQHALTGLDKFVTQDELAVILNDLKAQSLLIRTLNRDSLIARLDGSDKARELLAEDTKQRQGITDTALIDIKNILNASDGVVDSRAQAANDALERLLNASINGTIAISDSRYQSTQLAITKVEGQVVSAFTAAKAALDSALISANSAVSAVEAKLTVRLVSLKELIDLGTTMANEAISKAEKASEKRLDSMNEFRDTLSDQQKTFLQKPEAEARFSSIMDKLDGASKAIATSQLDMKSTISRADLAPLQADILKLRDMNSTSGGKEQTWATVGSAVLSIAAILVVLISAFHTPSSNSTSPLVGADTNRVTDLITQINASNAAMNARLDAISARINQFTSPVPAPAQAPVK